jgi:hypothetical protein
VIRYKAREFKFKDIVKGTSYWHSVFRGLPNMPVFVPRQKPPINIGEVLVAAAPSESSVRRANKKAEHNHRTAGILL